MSDYHDVSENDDTRGGVRRISGYDWDIDTENPEFNFDDERPLFEFDPRAEYLDLQVGKEDDDVMTYQVLGKLADMTLKLLACWEKRAAAYHLKKPDPTEQNRIELWGFKAFWQSRVSNLYQLKMEERNDLRSYSVWKLEKIFGGKDEVKESKQVSKNISYFVKRIILSIVGNSLPCPLPYPVIGNILSYLLAVKGLVCLGPELGSAPYNQVLLSFFPALTHTFHLVQSLGRSDEVDFFLSKICLCPKAHRLCTALRQ